MTAIDPATLRRRVAAGAAFLDQELPGWRGQVDRDRLDMLASEVCEDAGNCGCVLAWIGHPVRDYYGVFEALTGLSATADEGEALAERLGFTLSRFDATEGLWQALTRAWLDRLADDAAMPERTPEQAAKQPAKQPAKEATAP